jgi:hypothetical protein
MLKLQNCPKHHKSTLTNNTTYTQTRTSPTTLTYTKRIFQTSTVVYKTTIGVQPGHYCDQKTASKEAITLQSTFEALLFKESILQATTHELKEIPD